MRQVDGLKQDDAKAIVAARDAPYQTIQRLQALSDVSVSGLERLADADAFRSMGLDRRQALWQVRGLSKVKALPLFNGQGVDSQGQEADVVLPEMPLSEHVIADYQTLRLSLKAHPMALLRSHFETLNCVRAERVKSLADKTPVTIAGVVLVRQRPGTAKGVMFMTLEDETGVANAVVWPKTFETFRKIAMASRLVVIRGRIQSHDGVVHIVTRHMEDHSAALLSLSEEAGKIKIIAPSDEASKPQPERSARRHPRSVRIIPKSRDFH